MKYLAMVLNHCIVLTSSSYLIYMELVCCINCETFQVFIQIFSIETNMYALLIF